MTEEPVDLVYAWCDDTDARWRAKRMAVAERYGVAASPAENAECRYRGGDMLRYSIRSAMRNAPWIRNVFVVVDDDQTLPDWPELTGGKTRIVRHGEIIPSSCLPTFCPDVIEHHIFRICCSRYRRSSFFFASDGYPVMRFGAMRKPAANDLERTYRSGQELADRLLVRHFGMASGRRSPIGRLTHHNVDAYRKGDCIACYEAFRGDIEPFLGYPFRNCKIVHRVLYAGYALAVGHGHFRRATFNTNCTSAWWRRLLPAWADSLQIVSGRWREAPDLFARFRPKLVCFNDGPETTEDDFVWLRNYIGGRYHE